ncbi:MAG: histidinol-phosphatase HisJ family protein [Fusobacterium sp. JB019]|nr:histidinol-phosphatase HisJ family protein [Fusobacterium sp. JB019]
MYKVDYHIHTEFSGDSKENIESMIKRAIELGLSEIAITDHLEYDLLYIDWDKWTINLDAYKETVLSLQKKYKNKIIIKFGIELGVQPQTKDYLEAIVDKYDFDFVIASNHSIDKIDLACGILQKDKTRYEVQNLYFETVLKNIETYDKFNVFGHLDYVTRYGGSEFDGMDLEEHRDIITKILKTLISKGKGLEINTSGYRYGEDRVYPRIEILKKYFELGGEIITIGSDAHIRDHVFKDMDKAYEILEKLGVDYITTFDKMKPVLKKIN